MRTWILPVLAVSVGCVEAPEESWQTKPGTAPQSTATTTTTTSTPNTTTETPSSTGSTYAPPDCTSVLPPAPPFPISTIDIATEEDFDFDADGYIIYQSGDILAENPTTGDFQVVTQGVNGDPSGIQVNAANDLIVVSGHDSTIHINYRTGGSDLIMSGFSLPNGLEIGAGDIVFATDMGNGQVRWTDPATGDAGLVTAQLSSPDNLVLSPDEQTLYVATRDGIAILDRIPGTDEWDPVPSFVGGSLGWLYVVEIDSCGNLYTAVGTTIYRIDMTNDVIEPIADMPTGSFISSIRFGNGNGAFARTNLYATMRLDIHFFDVGIEGKRHPTTP